MVSSKQIIGECVDPARQYVYRWYSDNTATRIRIVRDFVDGETWEREGAYTEAVSVSEYHRISKGLVRR